MDSQLNDYLHEQIWAARKDMDEAMRVYREACKREEQALAFHKEYLRLAQGYRRAPSELAEAEIQTPAKRESA